MKINKELLAFSLGDCHINKNGRMSFVHSEKQKEYIEWKYKELNKFGSKNFKHFNNNGFPAYSFDVKTIEENKILRKKLYGIKGHKFYTKEIIEKMDLFCFAVLYCDDGSLCAKKTKEGKIHAYDLTLSIYGAKEECENLIEKLKKTYELDFTLKFNKGKYSIRCGTKMARKFLELIRPLIPNFECFKETKLKHI